MAHIVTFMTAFTAIIIVAAVVGLAVFLGNLIVSDQRSQQLATFAESHGLTFAGDHLPILKQLSGKPFVTFGGRAEDVIGGTHRGREVVIFNYHYSRRSNSGQTSTTRNYNFAVWMITLPRTVDYLEVGPEGVFGGKVAEAFGADRLRVGDPQFDQAYKVIAPHHAFGRAVMTPEVVGLLRGRAPTSWRLDGNVMISYERGRLSATTTPIIERLDVLCDILDTVPTAVWGTPR